MKNLCTLSDKNYLVKGLTLYNSLIATGETFTLHYLCIDDETFNTLQILNLEHVVPVALTDLINYNTKLKNSKKLLTYSNFCFSLAAYFCNYLLKGDVIEEIYYLDSDLFFYTNFDIIQKEIGNKSIGIIRHRHVQKGHRVGEYNVGLVYFKNNKVGINCSQKWWDLVIDDTNPYYAEYGTCGDQKYLELFELFYKNEVSVIDEFSSHGAPFNFHLYDFANFKKHDRKIKYKSKEHPLTFCHFMKFAPNFSTNTYNATDEPHNQLFLKIPEVKFLYDEYYIKTLETKQKYNL